jgi:DsbC/DsbD-like thiol-disulfide interchange protein
MRHRMTAGLGIRRAAALLAVANGEWSIHDTLRARLVSPVDAVGDRETIPAGLHLMLADGWKTYWRSPGDAGAPPRVDWSASENVAGVEWHWPAPHRFTLFGLETFGYDHVFSMRGSRSIMLPYRLSGVSARSARIAATTPSRRPTHADHGIRRTNSTA